MHKSWTYLTLSFTFINCLYCSLIYWDFSMFIPSWSLHSTIFFIFFGMQNSCVQFTVKILYFSNFWQMFLTYFQLLSSQSCHLFPGSLKLSLHYFFNFFFFKCFTSVLLVIRYMCYFWMASFICSGGTNYAFTSKYLYYFKSSLFIFNSNYLQK